MDKPKLPPLLWPHLHHKEAGEGTPEPEDRKLPSHTPLLRGESPKEARYGPSLTFAVPSVPWQRLSNWWDAFVSVNKVARESGKGVLTPTFSTRMVGLRGSVAPQGTFYNVWDIF